MSRNLALATHHASLLEQRKQTENLILDSLETLIDYPTVANPASQPSQTDIVQFQKLITPFQTSDYDALLEERNLTGRCAYVFCARPFAAEKRARGAVQFIGNRREGVRIVPRAQVRKWCCDNCARMAMFIKVQLSETPAWERTGGLGQAVEIMTEDVTTSFGKMAIETKTSQTDNADETMTIEGYQEQS